MIIFTTVVENDIKKLAFHFFFTCNVFQMNIFDNHPNLDSQYDNVRM